MLHIHVSKIISDDFPNDFCPNERELEADRVETIIDNNAGEIMAVVWNKGKRHAFNLNIFTIEIK